MTDLPEDENRDAAILDAFHHRLIQRKSPPPDEDLQRLAEILTRQHQAFSRTDAKQWEKRTAVTRALLAVKDYIQSRLPTTPTLLMVPIAALLDAESGTANPLFRPDPGEGRKGSLLLRDMRMARAAAVVKVLMNGDENEKAACRRVAQAAGCTASQLEDWRDKRRHDRAETKSHTSDRQRLIREHYDRLIAGAEDRIARGQTRSEIVSGMLAALKNSA